MNNQTPPADRVQGLLNEIGSIVRNALTPQTTSTSSPLQVPISATLTPIQRQSGSSSGNQQQGPIPAAGTSTTPTPSTVLSEVINRFRPYHVPSPRLRVAGRSAGRSGLARGQQRPWSCKFYSLSSPNDTKTPTQEYRQTLANNGLGQSVIFMDIDGDSSGVREAIRRQYPKLRDIEFELMSGSSGGYNKPLERINAIEAVPSPQYLKALRVTTIYIRPLVDIEILNAEINASLSEMAVSDEVAATSSADVENNEAVDSPVPAVTLTNQQADSSEEVKTLEGLRSEMLSKNPGIQAIYVARDKFIERILGVYKNPSLNLFQEPKVEFIGEQGADLGGVSREFFWKGLLALLQEKIDGKLLFEGEADHVLPAVDSRFLRSGVFKTIGKFMTHAIIHTGVGFLGMSIAAVEYLTKSDVDEDTPFTMSEEDLPDEDHRRAIKLMRELQAGASLDHSKLREIQEFAINCDWNDALDKSSAQAAIEHCLYFQVIERRRPHLDALKFFLKNSTVLTFLEGKEYMISAAYPRTRDIKYPSEMILRKIVTSGEEAVITFALDFIRNLKESDLQPLIWAWTGSGILPDAPLKITVDEDIEFKAQTCFYEITIPKACKKEDVDQWFTLLLQNYEGFGEY